MNNDDLTIAFNAHVDGSEIFTRRMAIHISEMAGTKPMSLVWRLEKMGLLKKGSYEWFQINGGITKSQIDEVLNQGAEK